MPLTRTAKSNRLSLRPPLKQAHLKLSFFLYLLLPLCGLGQTSLFVSDQNVLNIKGTLLSTDGNIENEGSITGDLQSILFLNGQQLQFVGDTLSDTFYLGSIYQDNPVGVCYNSNIYLYHDTGYWFIQGSAFTNDRDLHFRNSAFWIDNDTLNRFFVNKGLGLIYKYNSGPAITYPVGYDSIPAAYAPIILENFGTADHFGVRVQRNIDFHYKQPFGTSDSARILTHAINNTWIINEEVNGGTRMLYTPIWKGASELPGFDRSKSIVAWYSDLDHSWHGETSQAAMGSNPYSARRLDTLFRDSTAIANFIYMPVSVGDPLSVLPLEYINIRSSWNGTTPAIQGTYSFKEQVGQIALLRSVNGIDYAKIDTIDINAAIGAFDYIDNRFVKHEPKGWIYYKVKPVYHSSEVSSNSVSLYYNDEIKSLLFPNPTRNHINIYREVQSASGGKINIYSTNGQLVKSVSASFDEDNYLLQIPVFDLAPGMYQAILQINNQRIVYRFIKEK